MGINQLFKKFIPLEVLKKISNFFNIDIENLNKLSFTKKGLIDINTHFSEIQEILKPYYIPCKYKVYIENITLNKAITMYRQILKLHDFSLKSKDQYEKGTKYILYSIIKNDSPKKKNEGIIFFD